MSSVDDRIVNMQFNSSQFQQGAGQAQKSLSDTEKAMQSFAGNKSLGDAGKQVDGIRAKFGALQVAGVTAMATLTNKAVNAGLSFVKSLTIQPIIDGFKEYQLTLNSTQTVMANTGKSVGQVNNALDALNHYSDQTIYNFGQMAKNVGTFTAAGVDLNTAVKSIQGLSNIAALSGSSAEQASSAMYQLSQAIAAGRVNLQDWNSVVNAGMGGKQFQTALAITGNAMGTIADGALKLDKNFKVAKISGQSFRESISAKGKDGKSWLTSDVLTNTLEIMDGRLSITKIRMDNLGRSNEYVNGKLKEQQEILKKKGYTDEQVKALTTMADAAFNSATKVKTLTQLIDVTREAIGSTFAGAFRLIIGGFGTASDMFTKANQVIGAIITHLSDTLNKFLKLWIHVGGRFQFFQGIKNSFTIILTLMRTVTDAFREVFPPNAGHTLAHLSYLFQYFTKALIPSADTLDKLKRIFAGVFAVLHIGTTIIGAVFNLFAKFFLGVARGSGEASGGILTFLAHIGDLAVKLDKFVTSGGKIQDVFGAIGDAAGKAVQGGIGLISNALGNLASQIDGAAAIQKARLIAYDIIAGLANSLGDPKAYTSVKAAMIGLGENILTWIKGVLGIHSPSKEMAEVGKNVIEGLVQGIGDTIVFVFSLIGKLGAAIINGFKGMFSGLSAIDVASLLNAIFAGSLILTLRKMANAFSNFGSQLGKNFGAAMQQITSTLKTAQNALRAEALKALAVAIAILVGSVLLMKFIKPDEVKAGVAAISILLTEMTVAMATLDKIGQGGFKKKDKVKGILAGSARITALAGAFTAMASAVLILTGAVVLLGKTKPETLNRGLSAVTILLTELTVSMGVIGKMGGTIKGAAAAITAMAIAINLLTGPILVLGHQKLGTLVKGVGAIAVVIAAMTLSLATLSAEGPVVEGAAGAMIAMGTALILMAKSIQMLGKMKIGDLAKGLIAFTIALTLMTAALLLVGVLGPEATAAGLAFAAMGAGLLLMAKALAVIGSMSIGDIAKALVGMTVALVLLLAAAAVAIPLAPGLLALAITFAAIGAAVFLAGVGVAAFALGLSILATVGAAAIGVMVAAIDAFIALLPSIAVQMAAAFVSLLETLAKAAPQLRAAMATIIKAMLGAIGDANDEIFKLFTRLIGTAIKALVESTNDVLDAMTQLVMDMLTRIDDNLPDFIKKGSSIAISFLDGIATQSQPIAYAAGRAILGLLKAIDDAIVRYQKPIEKEGLQIAYHILDGMTLGLADKGSHAFGKLNNAVKGAAGGLLGGLAHHLGVQSPSTKTMEMGRYLVDGLAIGIINRTKVAIQAVREMANAVIAEGNKSILAFQKKASKAQFAADRAQAKVNATKKAAAAIKKTNPKKAKNLQARAEIEQKQADRLQKRADAAASGVDRAKEFANADNQGKGDIRNADAVRQSESATRLYAKAQAEARQAAELMKVNKAAGLAMLKQAKKDAEDARRLAAAAKRSHQAALKYYAAEVRDRIKQIEKDRAAQEQQKKDDAELAAADTQGKIDILNNRAAADQAKADAAKAEAARLLALAKKYAATDAKKAMEYLDKSEAQAQIAQEAADKAQQERDAVEQLQGGGGSSGGSTTDYTPSKAVIDDAAKAVDRYTASLAQAEALAAATVQPVQFYQYNTSPTELSPSEVYRNTHNLLSMAEDKLAVNP